MLSPLSTLDSRRFPGGKEETTRSLATTQETGLLLFASVTNVKQIKTCTSIANMANVIFIRVVEKNNNSITILFLKFLYQRGHILFLSVSRIGTALNGLGSPVGASLGAVGLMCGIRLRL